MSLLADLCSELTDRGFFHITTNKTTTTELSASGQLGLFLCLLDRVTMPEFAAGLRSQNIPVPSEENLRALYAKIDTKGSYVVYTCVTRGQHLQIRVHTNASCVCASYHSCLFSPPQAPALSHGSASANILAQTPVRSVWKA